MAKQKATVVTKNSKAALDVRMNSLAEGRKKRGRKAGDGGGVDIGIAPGFSGYEKFLNKMPKEFREKTLKQMRDKVERALEPVIHAAKKGGATKAQLELISDVGPNSMRTIMEFLEDGLE